MDDQLQQPQTAQPSAPPQQPVIYQMIQDPDFGKLAPSEQRKALSAHDPMFANAGDADIMRFVGAHKSAPAPAQSSGGFAGGMVGGEYVPPMSQNDLEKRSQNIINSGKGQMPGTSPSPQQLPSGKSSVSAATTVRDLNPFDVLKSQYIEGKDPYTKEEREEINRRNVRAARDSVYAYGLRSQKNPYLGTQAGKEKLLGDPGQLFSPGTPERGAGEEVGNLATATNATIGGGIAAATAFTGGLAPTAATVLSRLVGGGFTLSMAKGLYDTNKEYKKAVDSGDLDKAKELQGKAAIDIPLTLLAAHGTAFPPKFDPLRDPGTLSGMNREDNVTAKHHEAMASLLDTNAGKVDPMDTSKSALPVMRNEAAKAGIGTDSFKGREGGKLGYQLADKGIESHQGEIDSISKPFMKDKVDLSPIAQSIRSKITDEMRNNAPDQALRIENEAKNFDRTGTIEELNEYRKRSNKEQQAFYRGNQTKQIMSEADVAASVKGANAARDVQYTSIGNRAGVDPKYIRGLFDQEGSMIDARNALSKEYNNASKAQAIAKSQTWREALVGTKGKTSIQDAKSQLLKGVFGMKPMNALNTRLSRAFDNLGDPQPYSRPPAPGGVPPYGPNRPMLPEGNPPATQLGPSDLPQQKLLGTGQPSGDITLHQPPIDAPTQMRDAARTSGRDMNTGRFQRAYTNAPATPFDDQPIYQHPGVMQRPLTNPAPESISQARFNAIMDDIKRNAANRQSPNQPVPVKDSVFQHIKDAQKAQDASQAPAVAPEANTPQGTPSGGDRRVQYPDFREKLKQLPEDEQVRTAFIRDETGLPNAKAYNLAQQDSPAKFVFKSDADALKTFNDKYGWEYGNMLLKAKAEALQEAGIEAYHHGGDEFSGRANYSEGELRTRLENARNILRSREFDVTLKDGSHVTLTGADFSYGTGENDAVAEKNYVSHKEQREAAGERKRGELGRIHEINRTGTNSVYQTGSAQGK